MKTVLVVGPDFAPSSMPPALRLRFLVRHLPEFDWNPVVLAVDPRCYEQPTDAENERLLPDGLEVIRTSAASPTWTRSVGIGDLGLRSLRHQWKAIRKICASRRIDLLLLSVPPYPTMVLGRLAYRRFGIPYVVDYQDPWLTDYYAKRPRNERPPKWRLFHALGKTLEPFALREVAHITGVSKGTTDPIIRRYPWLHGIGSSEIPLGVEPADFEYLRRQRRSNPVFTPGDGRMHVSYVGVCIPGMHAALRALFDAVRLGRKADAALFGRLRLHFVGTSYAKQGGEQVMPIARDMGVEEAVTERVTRVPYLDALQILLDSDGLVAIGSDAPHYTASKLFPYILAQKPLLAIFHRESSVVRILEETRAGKVVTFDSAGCTPGQRTPEVRDWLARLLASPEQLQPQTDWKAFEPYTSRGISRWLAQAFEQALSRHAARSARVPA